MSDYKLASKLGLRINTTVGPLSVEQLWTLSLAQLDQTAVKLEEEYKASGKKSFLVKKTKKDKELKLAFDIVVDVLNTKVEEKEAHNNAAEIKEHNQKIYERIAKAKDAELDDLSVKELEKLLK